MTKLDKMLKKESQAGTKAEQRKNDEVLTSSPACTKPTVICSQSGIDRPPNILFSIGNLNFYKGNGDSCPIIKILKARALKLRPQ